MEETLTSMQIRLKGREILVSSSHNELATVVNRLFLRKESKRYQTARTLYDHCVSDFPDCLALKLLQVYQSSSDGVTRFRSIYQLSETLNDLRNRDFKLSLDSLYEIKRALIPCLTMQETKESDIKILRRIVSCVAYNVVELHKGEWDELGDCILTLANQQEPVKAFHVFVDLPTVYKSSIDKFKPKIWEKACTVFLDPYRVEHWSLALQTLVKMWIQLVKTGMSVELINVLMEIQVFPFVSSVKKLIEMEKELFLVKGLEDFERFFSRDMSLYHYTTDQCRFVSTLMSKIEGFGTHLTKEVVMRIKMLVTGQDNRAMKPHDDLKNRFDCGWNDHLKNLSSLEVLRIFASTELEDRSREIAIRRLNVLLSDHTSEKVPIDIAEMRQIQPLLISCLKEEGISDSMFKVLGEVVNHVTYEMMVYNEDKCYELRDYITSSETGFQRAISIFQCFTMALADEEFLIPVMEKLIPDIITGLDPPGELLVDNSCWVLAFTGALCAATHMIDDYVDAVKDIALKMVDSVGKLVEREMEVGFVRRAFRDAETIVKKQLEWYGTSEYRFLKGLLWRLYAIKGMKWESKIVLWRINVIVERKVKEEIKVLPENEFDWLNLGEDDGDNDDGDNDNGDDDEDEE
ncbi:PREDICTED: uncharacterized protein LOC104724101 [Camelina sativa]|uniref:Uncharacterized protein LOC104724101 n=1 Tax=Camelina sativa TaxID=90675 RepID=A0ABM0UGL0_CAMSA|nr:PREDICTED: uncharacterized protein LOC104724101 [Camelina sativa]